MNRRPRSYQERALPLSYLGPFTFVVNSLSLSLVEGVGFEPTKPFRAPDLQSGGFNHSPTPPVDGHHTPFKLREGVILVAPGRRVYRSWSRAPEGIRTPNLSITNRLRYLCATGALRRLTSRILHRGDVRAGPLHSQLARFGLYKIGGQKSILFGRR